MSTADVTLRLNSDHLFQDLVDRLQFAEAAEAWSRSVNHLNVYENEHLYVQRPASGRLEEHKKMVERLIRFGQLLAFVTSFPEFNDTETSEMIQATQFLLHEKFQMFHNPMDSREADRILKEVFPEP